jgi:hypothetical protein
MKDGKRIVKKSELPVNSVLKIDQAQFDYIDSFVAEFSDSNQRVGATVVGKAFFSSGPKWIDRLFDLRNKIVRRLGLKTSGNGTNREEQLRRFQCEPGEHLGLFKVFHKSENEVVIGEDDRHLDFRVSLSVSGKVNKTLALTTTVKFRNGFGRLYFLPVRPFHKLIVPAMLGSIVSELEN